MENLHWVVQTSGGFAHHIGNNPCRVVEGTLRYPYRYRGDMMICMWKLGKSIVGCLSYWWNFSTQIKKIHVEMWII